MKERLSDSEEDLHAPEKQNSTGDIELLGRRNCRPF